MKQTTLPVSRTYAAAERFLLGLVNYEVKPPPMRTDHEGWHLAEFARMLDALGKPQEAAPIVHVAGTKGKGSTTRMIAGLLGAVGCRRVGSFLSPHIEFFRERICLNNTPIRESAFVRALEAVRAHCAIGATEGFRTTFEVLTAMALWTFRESSCDAVVLETGLGGRLDATNVPTSRVAVITAIGYDHQRVLGHTLRAIASEKAGIIKPGTGAAVVGPQQLRRARIVREVVLWQAHQAGVPVRLPDKSPDPIARAVARSWGFDLTLNLGGKTLTAQLHALGRHQLNNLRTALMAVETFAELEGKRIVPGKIAKAIENLRFPGRCEVWSRNPAIVLDSAHCALSARAAASACREHFDERPIALVLGMLGDKNHAAILRELARAGRIAHVRTYTPPTPRACPAEEVAHRAARVLPDVRACASVSDAIGETLALAARDPNLVILVAGTFYGLAPARHALEFALGARQEGKA